MEQEKSRIRSKSSDITATRIKSHFRRRISCQLSNNDNNNLLSSLKSVIGSILVSSTFHIKVHWEAVENKQCRMLHIYQICYKILFHFITLLTNDTAQKSSSKHPYVMR